MRAASRKNVNQLFQLREYAKLEELRCRATFKDECSARDEEEGSERPGFKAACALALKKERAIPVVDASRFSRTEESYDRFVRAGGKVYDLRGFGEDEAWMRSRIKFAKRDGDIRSRKTLEGQAKAKAAGKIFGSPYLDKAREASAASRTMDALIRRREFERLVEAAEKEGMTTPEAIAGWLNKKGYSTTEGKRWAASNVRRMLRGIARSKPAHGAPGSDLVTPPPKPVRPPKDERVIAPAALKVAPADKERGERSVRPATRPMPPEKNVLLLAQEKASRERQERERLEKAEKIDDFYADNPNYGIF